MLVSLRSVIFCLNVTVLAVSGHLAFAGDAAIEIQEGNVENWIKYYERERGIDIPAPVKKTPKADSREVDIDSEEVSRESIRESIQ